MTLVHKFTHLSSLDVPDIDSLILIKGDGFAFGGHLDLHGGNILQWPPDHPAVPGQSVSSLHVQEKDDNTGQCCPHIGTICRVGKLITLLIQQI